MKQQQWIVTQYETEAGQKPVQDFMDSLPGRDQRKLITMIKMLEKTGIQLRAPHAKAIEGEKNLFELRSQLGNNIQRVFYCHFTGIEFILLHGFTKKTQKTPQREIMVALTRRAEYFKRNSP